MSISDAADFFTELADTDAGDDTVVLLLKEITNRLGYLTKVGLGYLSLDRQSRTLSGGEVARASLTCALGSSLVNTLYVLDEPSIGLHPRDTHLLLDVLQALRDLGNTIVIVEHDPDIIARSDRVIDLGPRSGEDGGHIMYAGPPAGIVHAPDSLTGAYFAGKRRIALPQRRRTPAAGARLRIQNAQIHNLQNLSFDIPLGLFVCITGVSGSGKSTLLEEVIHQDLTGPGERRRCCRLEGDQCSARHYLHGPGPDRQNPAFKPRNLHKNIRCNPKTFRRQPACTGARLYGFNLFIQCARRPL